MSVQLLLVPLFFQLRLLQARPRPRSRRRRCSSLQNTVYTVKNIANNVKITRPTRLNPPASHTQLISDRGTPSSFTVQESTELSESESESTFQPPTPPVQPTPPTQPTQNIMATAKPLKPNTYDGEKLDPQTGDIWLARMTTYLRLTNTAEADRVEIASSYLKGVAYTWFMNERATLTTFDLFKSTFRGHFVPQNYKDVAYRRYKALTQGTLSVTDYSIQLKTLADQISDLVPSATRDLDFVNGLHYRIKQFIVAQPPIMDEKWSGLVGRALRQEETLPADYNRVKAAPPSDAAQHGVSRNQNNARSTGTGRSGNWR